MSYAPVFEDSFSLLDANQHIQQFLDEIDRFTPVERHANLSALTLDIALELCLNDINLHAPRTLGHVAVLTNEYVAILESPKPKKFARHWIGEDAERSHLIRGGFTGFIDGDLISGVENLDTLPEVAKRSDLWVEVDVGHVSPPGIRAAAAYTPLSATLFFHPHVIVN